MGLQEHAVRAFWELVDPVVADTVAQDNDKRNNIQIYIYIYRTSILKYTEGRDKTSPYSYLDVILSKRVPDNWVYRLPGIFSRMHVGCPLPTRLSCHVVLLSAPSLHQ